MAITEQNLRDYLRLPPDDEENLTRYLAAARSKARAAGIREFRNNAQYDLFLLSLAAAYYDNRGMTTSGTNPAAAEEAIQKRIDSFVLELRYATEDDG